MEELLKALESDKYGHLPAIYSFDTLLLALIDANKHHKKTINIEGGTIINTAKVEYIIDGVTLGTFEPTQDNINSVRRAIGKIQSSSMVRVTPPNNIPVATDIVLFLSGKDELYVLTWIDDSGIYVEDMDNICWRVDPSSIQSDRKILLSAPAVMSNADGSVYSRNNWMRTEDRQAAIERIYDRMRELNITSPALVSHKGTLYFRMNQAVANYYEPVPGYGDGVNRISSRL